MTNAEYIEWYNNLPLIGQPSKTCFNRGFCKACKQPFFMRENEEDEVVIDLKHFEDCTFWTKHLMQQAWKN